MRYVYTLPLFMLLSGCQTTPYTPDVPTKKQSSTVKNSALKTTPAWVINPTENNVVFCSVIEANKKKYAQVEAKHLAKAKYLSQQSIKVEGTDVVVQSSQQPAARLDTQSSYKTQGFAKAATGIKREEEVLIGNIKNWCVSYGVL